MSYLSPVGLSRSFVVRYFHGDASSFADFDGFLYCVDEGDFFASDVGSVDSSELGHHLGELHEFVGVGVTAWWVDETCGHAEDSVFHGLG